MDKVGLGEDSRELQEKGDHDTKDDEDLEKEDLLKEQATEFPARHHRSVEPQTMSTRALSYPRRR